MMVPGRGDAACWLMRLVRSAGGIAPAECVHSAAVLRARLARMLDLPVPLTGVQERALWLEALRRDAAHAPNATPGLARSLQRSWALVRAHGCPETRLAGTREAEALKCWARSVLNRSRAMERLPAPELHGALIEALGRGARPAVPDLLIAGWAELVPADRELLQALAKAGVRILEVAEDESEPRFSEVLPARDIEQECAMVAAYASDAAANGRRVLVLVPDWTDYRSMLEAALVDEAGRRGLPPADWPALPLGAHPRIAAARRLLGLAGASHLPRSELQWLMLNPLFRGGAAERWARAALDAGFRRLNRDRIALAELAGRLERDAVPMLPGLIEALRAFPTGRLSASDWVAMVGDLLRASGWFEGLDEPEAILASNAFRDALHELVGLDALGARRAHREWLAWLDDRLERPAPAIGRNAPIAVRLWHDEALPASDIVVVMGMDDRRWPSPPDPDGWIPVDVQVAFGMPCANAELAARESRQWLVRLRRRMGDRARFVASFPGHRDDAEVGPASCIRGLPASLPSPSGADRGANAGRERAEPVRDAAVPLPAGTHSMRGGSHAFRDLAACPFRYVVLHRLKARELDATQPGPTPAQQGQAVHRMLELVWRELKTSRELKRRIEEGSLDGLIESAAGQAVRAIFSSFDARIQTIEQARLVRLIRTWLIEREASRDPFRVVACEHDRTLELEANDCVLSFRIRIDREDEADGRRILVDYKTGNAPAPSAWHGQRPREPQMPMYALAVRQEDRGCDSLVYGIVRADEPRFKGEGRGEPGIPGVRPVKDEDWDARIEEWREVFAALADEMTRGIAEIRPRDRDQDCARCPVRIVCRIDEAALAQHRGDRE